MQERIVHLIRHAEAFHNAEGAISVHRFFLGGEWRRFSSLVRVWRSIWRLIRSWFQGKNKQESSADNEHLDAVLTPTGCQQVAELRKHCREVGIAQGVQLVVVSPMTRTLQTAVGVFRYKGDDNSDANLPLLTDKVTERSNSLESPPIVAIELCRERMNVRPSDKRNPISKYKMEFPQVDFSQVETDEDTWWNPEVTESQEHLHVRIKAFLQWLLTREEQEIAVISHSRFLREMMSRFGENKSPFIYFRNGKLRTVRIITSLDNFRILDP